MRKGFCFLICLLMASAPFCANASEDATIGNLLREAQVKYAELSKQAMR